MTDKIHYTYDQIHHRMKRLVKKINFKPDYIVAIGGGGLVPGRILRTYLNVPVLVVTLESYSGENKGTIVRRQWLDEDQIRDKRILIVDDLNDTGSTLVYCVNEMRKAGVADVAVAVIHHKTKEREKLLDSSIPYYVGEHVEDRWIVYPWEI